MKKIKLSHTRVFGLSFSITWTYSYACTKFHIQERNISKLCTFPNRITYIPN